MQWAFFNAYYFCLLWEREKPPILFWGMLKYLCLLTLCSTLRHPKKKKYIYIILLLLFYIVSFLCVLLSVSCVCRLCSCPLFKPYSIIYALAVSQNHDIVFHSIPSRRPFKAPLFLCRCCVHNFLFIFSFLFFSLIS